MIGASYYQVMLKGKMGFRMRHAALDKLPQCSALLANDPGKASVTQLSGFAANESVAA
jgi:hypothetical protein